VNRAASDQVSSVLTWAALALLAWLVYLVVQPFLIPLGWACVLAVLLYPLQRRLLVRRSPARAALTVTLFATAVLIAPAVALTNVFAHEMVDIAGGLQSALAQGQAGTLPRMWEALVARVPYAASIDVGSLASDLLRRSGSFLMAQSGAVLTNIAVFFIDLVLALFATFFLLRDADAIMRAVRRLLPMAPAAREAFLARTGDLIAAGVTSSVVVAGLQGLAGGIAFALVGLSAPVFWGVVMAFACLLPFGAWVVWLPGAVVLAVSGSVTRALVLVALGFGIVSMVDNVIRPMLLSGRVHMNGLVIFVSLLGGLNVFGLLGIVLGPIIVVTAISLVQSYVDTPTDDVIPT
jgi:predicted PurR-regulated permease PerM